MPYQDPDRQRAYNRERCAGRRAEWFRGKACAHCGSTDRLELDHVDPGLKISHNVWSWSPARREAELAKCQPLCHDCHLAKSRLEKRSYPGEQQCQHRLTESDVREIRAATATNAALADQYGVSAMTISRVRRGVDWKHVPL